MSFRDRIRAAWHAFLGDADEQEYHRYGIVIGEVSYMADSYSIDPYDGSPEWDYYGADGHIHCKKHDGWILKEWHK